VGRDYLGFNPANPYPPNPRFNLRTHILSSIIDISLPFVLTNKVKQKILKINTQPQAENKVLIYPIFSRIIK
jgi:hypothetical protein